MKRETSGPVLICYSSVHGQTRKIAQRIAHRFESAGAEARLMEFGDAHASDAADCGAFIVGAPVRYGRHDRRLARFVARHAEPIRTRPFGLFSVDLISRNPEKTDPDNNVYARKLLDRLAVRPDLVGIFAGRLDYPRYGWLDRRLIQLIMKIMDGPTDPSTTIEYTDWERVDRFADEMRKLTRRDPGDHARTG